MPVLGGRNVAGLQENLSWLSTRVVAGSLNVKDTSTRLLFGTHAFWELIFFYQSAGSKSGVPKRAG